MDDARTLDKFVIRLPDGLRPEIAATARFNQRSMNGEIIFRLQHSIDCEQVHKTQSHLVTQLLKRIDQLESLSPASDCSSDGNSVQAATDFQEHDE